MLPPSCLDSPGYETALRLRRSPFQLSAGLGQPLDELGLQVVELGIHATQGHPIEFAEDLLEALGIVIESHIAQETGEGVA